MMMVWRGLVVFVALSTAAAVVLPMVESEDGVNDTVPADKATANLTQRVGEDGSINFQSEVAPAPIPEALASRVDRVVSRRVTHLALQVQGAIRETQTSSTLLFSPLSISGALHLLWVAARGRTAEELAAFIGRSPDLGLDTVLPSIRRLNKELATTSGGTQVDVANGLFLQYGYPVRTWYANISKDVFDTEIYGVEFATNGEAVTTQINGWVSKKTKGRINKFLNSPLPGSTKVLITNCLYFNGAWENPFPLETSMMRPYTIPGEDGGEPEVRKLMTMINSGDLPYARNEELNCNIIGLPYKGKQVTMYLVQPIEQSFEAFKTLVKNLTVENMEALQSATKETPVIITVPRMRIQSTLHLRETMDKLGVKTLFNPLQADLGLMSPGKKVALETFSVDPSMDQENSSSSGSSVGFPGRSKRETTMVQDNPGLFVDDLIHKVEIEVTETGTVASAVTAGTVTRDGARKVLRFDRPFLFFIRHESTGMPLFWGSVVRPVT